MVRTEKGFTLIELLIAIAASLVVLGAIAAVFFIQSKSFREQARIVEMQENARAGIEMMTRELQMAGYDPTGTSGAGIVSADSDTVRFTRDLDGDGDTGDSNEDVTYGFDGTDLQATRNGQPLAENIQSLSFSYYDTAGAELSDIPLDETDRANLRKIRILLTARTRSPDPAYSENNGYRTKTLGSDVTPRNMSFYAPVVDETTQVTTTTTTTTTTTSTSTTSSTTSTTTSTTTTTSNPTTTTTTTTLPPSCELTVSLEACKKNGNHYVYARARVLNGPDPVTGATVTWEVNDDSQGSLTYEGGGYYGGSSDSDCGIDCSSNGCARSGSRYNEGVSVSAVASKDGCTPGSALLTLQ